MGLDMALFVEVKENNRWKLLLEDGNTYDLTKDNRGKIKKWLEEDFDKIYDNFNWLYNNRNSYLFSIMANINNYSDIKSIEYKNGLPEDVSEIVKFILEDEDFHNINYCMLEDIKTIIQIKHISRMYM